MLGMLYIEEELGSKGDPLIGKYNFQRASVSHSVCR